MIRCIDKHNLPKGIRNVIITNSLSTGDYVKGYSDCDAIIILGSEVLLSPKEMAECQNFIRILVKYLYLFDPFQHHGFFIINEIDFEIYPETYFPLSVIGLGRKVLEKKVEFRVKTRHVNLEKRVALYNILIRLSHYARSPDSVFNNLYHFKSFVSNVTLFPCIYIQLFDDFIYKRDALNKIGEYLSSISAFKTAEHIRNTFPQKRYFRDFPKNINASLIPRIHGKLYRNNVSKNVAVLKRQVNTLIDETLDKLKDELY